MPKYHYKDKLTKPIKKTCDKLIEIIPDLSYIESVDFDVIIAVEPSRKDRHTGLYTIASMNRVTHWLGSLYEQISGISLPPFVMIIYPQYFHQRLDMRIKDLIHELFHIAPSKQAIRDHYGFGDEAIYKMFEKNIRKIHSQVGKPRG